MKKNNTLSYILVSCVGLLLTIGLIIIASVSADSSMKVFGTPYYYLLRHLSYIIIGVFIAYIVSRININFIKKYSLFFLLINIFLFIAVFVFGFSAGGATRWLSVGPIMIQPAEFIKLTFIIYLCSWLSKIKDKKSRKSKKDNDNLLPGLITSFILFVVSGIFLYLQPDFSNLAILFVLAATIYFLAKTPLWHSFVVVLSGLTTLAVLIKIAPYRLQRLEIFFNHDLDPMGKGYQIKQALIAIGSGGIFGLGLGMSRQKMGFLPEAMNDAIFAVFNEETGFIGGCLIILIFLAFLWTSILIAKKSSDSFSYLLASGITVWIILQAFVNMAAMLRVLPLTGVALPFLSYGGSHLIAELIAVGLLLNIAKNKK